MINNNSGPRKMPGGPVPTGAVGAGSNGTPARHAKADQSQITYVEHDRAQREAMWAAKEQQAAQGLPTDPRTLRTIIAEQAQRASEAAARDKRLAMLELERARHHAHQAEAKQALANQLRHDLDTREIRQEDAPAVYEIAAVDFDSVELATTDDKPAVAPIPWGWVGGTAVVMGGLWWVFSRKR